MTAVNQQSEQTQQALPAGTWKLDPIHSSAGFAVKHMVVATFRGRFEDFDATLEVTEDGTGSLVGAVDPKSIVVKDENLAGHLQAPDFFDAEQHPEITFRATELTLDGERATITGELTCSVDMGRASTTSKDFPSGGADGRGTLEAGGRSWEFQHVSVGNPQCAIVVAEGELDELDLGEIGPATVPIANSSASVQPLRRR